MKFGDRALILPVLDLCYTTSHVYTFVVISDDSDFAALASKLRENDRVVIGVGAKKSLSDLLIPICDDFIYYDDMVREVEKQHSAKRKMEAKKGCAQGGDQE